MRYNGNKFSVYESEEKTVLGLLDELGSQVNHNTDTLDTKTDLHGNHLGSWQGLSRPTMSEEGMRATVDDIVDNKIPSIQSSLNNVVVNKIPSIQSSLDNVVDNKIPSIQSSLDNKANKDEYVRKGHGTLNDFNEETRRAILENNNIDINYVLGLGNVVNENIGDNEIDYSKLDFIKVDKSINVFDKTKAIGKYQIDLNGKLVAHEHSYATDYIKVFPNDVINTTSTWVGAFYNSNKEFIKSKEFGITSIVAPEGARYYRESVRDELINQTMICINNDLPSTYQPYYNKINFDNVFKNEIKKSAKEDIVEADDTEFFNKVIVNLFDKEKVRDYKVIDIGTGALKDHDIGCATDFIEVKPNHTYTIKTNWEGAFYNSNKEFLSGKLYGVTTFDAPSNAYYFRYAINMQNKDTEMMVEGNSLPENYLPHTEDLFFTKESFVKTIYKQLHPLNGKKWVCVGDSLTEKNIRATKRYYDYIAEETGINVVVKAVGGTGYKNGEESNIAFYQRVANIPTDADIITIFGSGNDLGSKVGINKLGTPEDITTDTICGCMNITIQNIFKKIPGAKIGIVLPCPWGNLPPSNPNNNMAVYSDALREVAKRHSIPVLDLYYGSNLRPWDETFKELYYKRDEGNWVHPDEDGHKILANKFKMFIQSL